MLDEILLQLSVRAGGWQGGAGHGKVAGGHREAGGRRQVGGPLWGCVEGARP